jgi:hypothetical protein
MRRGCLTFCGSCSVSVGDPMLDAALAELGSKPLEVGHANVAPTGLKARASQPAAVCGCSSDGILSRAVVAECQQLGQEWQHRAQSMPGGLMTPMVRPQLFQEEGTLCCGAVIPCVGPGQGVPLPHLETLQSVRFEEDRRMVPR